MIYWIDKKEISKIEERFEAIDEYKLLYKYEIKGIKERLIIQIIDKDDKKSKYPCATTIRVKPVIYEGYGNSEVLHLPLGEISSQFDFKNVLINELTKNLKGFKKSLFENPIEKPGIHRFIILKLAFLLDMPGICYLFLKGKHASKKQSFSRYRLSNSPKLNAQKVQALSHNIGGFLKDKAVREIMRDMGKEEVLDLWYDLIAKAKVAFLRENSVINLKQHVVDRELRKLKIWFGERYSVGWYWQSIGFSRWLPFSIIILTSLSMVGGPYKVFLKYFHKHAFFSSSAFIVVNSHYFFFIGILLPIFVAVFLDYKKTKKVQYENIEEKLSFIESAFQLSNLSKFLFRILKYPKLSPLIFVIFKIFKIPQILFELLSPRLFVGTFIGAFLFYSFDETLWRVALKNDFIWFFPGVVSILSILFFYTRIEKEIRRNPFANLWNAFMIFSWTTYLSFLSVGINSYLMGELFVGELIDRTPDRIPICSQFLIFWVSFSVFIGIFLQLFWQKEKITEPI